ncbi:bifunctional (p)ppGpp synthetase/guanosine-3',5'-bis(diphosphate) 3'-pyrophosphohydrolase [Acinetobacter qingfengensis]|nr:bifunctional (p)ppGpp synthetase/guanosine-3',5'-bis(diphosphate) 3'-pyrophosphohydrolase [Acinetobacter qingfengensis]
MNALEHAIKLAICQHQQQVDKAGQPYILHPLNVMRQVQSTDAKIVAVLHDILEDTEITVNDLIQMGFQAHVVTAIIALTKRSDENRFKAAQRTKLNPLACEVKLADLQHNMQLSRLKIITNKDLRRYRQYQIIQAILNIAWQIHQHFKYLTQDEINHAKFHYTTLQENYANLLKIMLLKHNNMSLQRIVKFTPAIIQSSQYFTFCQRKKLAPQEKHFLFIYQKILVSHQNNDQLKFIFKQFKQYHFEESL